MPWDNIKEGTEEPSMSELGSEGHGDSLTFREQGVELA